MNSVLVVDPGIRGCGVTLYGDRVLQAAYVRNPLRTGDGPEAWVSMARAIGAWVAGGGQPHCTYRLVIEVPRVYQAGKQKGDPNDLLPLVGIGGALAATSFVTQWVRFYPHEWKGQVDPDLIPLRVKERLTPEEFAAISFPYNTCEVCADLREIAKCTKSTCLAHNIFDSVGLSLKDAGRFEKRRVIAR